MNDVRKCSRSPPIGGGLFSKDKGILTMQSKVGLSLTTATISPIHGRSPIIHFG